MGTRDGTNLVPEDRAGFLRSTRGLTTQGEILDPLGVQMNFAMIVARQAFEQFGESPFRPMPAVDERRNDREPQVSASKGGDCWGTD